MSSAPSRTTAISTTNYIGDNNEDCGNVIDSYNQIELNYYATLPADERCALLEWLSPLNPSEKHNFIATRRVDGVGKRHLRTPQFIQWSEGGDETVNRVLFCSGDPGVGKTYLSSLVIDELSDREDVDSMAVASVYCEFQAKDGQSATELLGVLLKQVVSALKPIPNEVLREFENSKRSLSGRRLRLPGVTGMLVKPLSCLRRGFICIDALDEFPENFQKELWVSLQEIVQKCSNTRLFLTGRPHVAESIRKYFPRTAEMLTISPTKHEIGLYVKMRLSEESGSSAMNKELEADILRIVLEISEIFLLVSLNMDAILAERTIYLRKRVLGMVTKDLGLEGVYSTTLNRIRAQGGSKEFGIEALMWISHSERPLKSAELCHALGVELGEDFSTQNVLSIRTILDCTLGLVTFDKNTSTVRLVHFTLQEYLRQHTTLFVSSHSMMAEICLTYLNCRSLWVPRRDPDTHLKEAPFLEYATCFWADHAARGVTEPVKSLALRLLDGYENHVSAAILWRKKICRWYSQEDVQGITGLHCIAFGGVEEIAIAMLEKKTWDVTARDSRGDTPLMWAVRYGNDKLVKRFLEQEDIKPDAAMQDRHRVFLYALGTGKLGAVGLLLGHVDPNSLDNNGQTPLSLAVSRGHERLLKLLLNHKDVNPNARDGDGKTPLLLATTKNLEGAVKLLLKRGDVNPNARDNGGQTPLLLATTNNLEGVVKLLLKRGDVNPNLPDNDGRTPLSHVAGWMAENMMEKSLEHGGVNPNSPNNNRGTALSSTAILRSAVLVRLLLERGDVLPDFPDANGRTPLSFAASGGNEDVVNLLLQRVDVNPNLPDNNGRTPLSFAAECWYQRVVNFSSENRGPIATSAPSPRPGSPFFFQTLIILLFALIFLLLLIYYCCRDSYQLVHAINIVWQ